MYVCMYVCIYVCMYAGVSRHRTRSSSLKGMHMSIPSLAMAPSTSGTGIIVLSKAKVPLSSASKLSSTAMLTVAHSRALVTAEDLTPDDALPVCACISICVSM